MWLEALKRAAAAGLCVLFRGTALSCPALSSSAVCPTHDDNIMNMEYVSYLCHSRVKRDLLLSSGDPNNTHLSNMQKLAMLGINV